MRGLIGCEKSQVVMSAFNKIEGNFFRSCDILPCEGAYPELHIQDSIFHVLSGAWLGLDFLGLHPDCTFLTGAGVRWISSETPRSGYDWSDKYQIYINWKRYADMVDACKFFNSCLSWIETIGMGYVENPVPHKYAMEYIKRPYDQIIQPWQHGHTETKKTCLWLFGVPKIKETNNVYDEMMNLPYKDRAKCHYESPGPLRAARRSQTLPGIGNAFADQWGMTVKNNSHFIA